MDENWDEWMKTGMNGWKLGWMDENWDVCHGWKNMGENEEDDFLQIYLFVNVLNTRDIKHIR